VSFLASGFGGSYVKGGEWEMAAWQYLVLKGVSLGGRVTTDVIQMELDERGKDGWELVTIQNFELDEGQQTLIIFKRPVVMTKKV